MVSIDDLTSAIQGLRGEVQGIVAPMMGQLRQEVMAGFKEMNDRSIQEIGNQVQALKEQVEAHHLDVGATVAKSVEDQFVTANKAFVAEQARLTEGFASMQEAIQKVSDASQSGGTDRFIALLMQQKIDADLKTDTVAHAVHATIKGQVNEMSEKWTQWSVATDARLLAFDSAGFGGPPGVDSRPSQGRGGYQFRVPDPKAWQLDVLKDGSHGFAKWRKGFDLQVNAVWNGLDLVLEAVRRSEDPITQVMFESMLLEHAPIGQDSVVRDGASKLDWNYTYISTKLYMVLYTHCDTDPIKIMEECDRKCGFEGYRLLTRAYDVYNENDEVTMLNHVLQIGQWSVK